MLWPTSSDNGFTISPARSAIELTSAAALFRAYAAGLPVDLAPQGFSQELQSLPGAYGPPAGELLLAKRGDHVLGCIALKALEPPGIAEIKRLFVRPQARKIGVGQGVGVPRSSRPAKNLGYGEIKLDTLPEMASAIALYQRNGFSAIQPYGSHPYPGLVTLGKSLAG